MKLLVFFTFSLLSLSASAQDFSENKEGWDYLPKGTLRKEIASFSLFGENEKNNSIKPGKTFVIASSGHFMTIRRENITAIIRIKTFDKSKYKIKKNADGRIVTINNKHVFGRDYDNDPPSTVMQSVMVIIGSDTLRLPSTAYADLFEPRSCETNIKAETNDLCPKIHISSDKRRIYIFSQHSDGAGAYEVTWIIQDKKYLRRVVDYGY